jgi:hypothetical protein
MGLSNSGSHTRLQSNVLSASEVECALCIPLSFLLRVLVYIQRSACFSIAPETHRRRIGRIQRSGEIRVHHCR